MSSSLELDEKWERDSAYIKNQKVKQAIEDIRNNTKFRLDDPETSQVNPNEILPFVVPCEMLLTFVYKDSDGSWKVYIINLFPQNEDDEVMDDKTKLYFKKLIDCLNEEF